MEIKSLEHIDFDTLFRGFENAFSDYEISFDKEEVRSMLIRRGYDSCLSFAAFVDNEIVAFTLNGIGRFNGIPNGYFERIPRTRHCRKNFQSFSAFSERSGHKAISA